VKMSMVRFIHIGGIMRHWMRGRTNAQSSDLVAATSSRSVKPFNLLRWFSLLSLACVVALSAALAMVLSRFMTNAMLERDAAISSQFVEGFAHAKPVWSYFVDLQKRPPDPALMSFFDSFFEHFLIQSDVIRANVYAQDQTVIWSSTAELIGTHFGPNDVAFERAGVIIVAARCGCSGLVSTLAVQALDRGFDFGGHRDTRAHRPACPQPHGVDRVRIERIGHRQDDRIGLLGQWQDAEFGQEANSELVLEYGRAGKLAGADQVQIEALGHGLRDIALRCESELGQQSRKPLVLAACAHAQRAFQCRRRQPTALDQQIADRPLRRRNIRPCCKADTHVIFPLGYVCSFFPFARWPISGEAGQSSAYRQRAGRIRQMFVLQPPSVARPQLSR
jgi:hypothetical protein